MTADHTIRVDEDIYAVILKEAADYEQALGRRVTLNEALRRRLARDGVLPLPWTTRPMT